MRSDLSVLSLDDGGTNNKSGKIKRGKEFLLGVLLNLPKCPFLEINLSTWPTLISVQISRPVKAIC